MAEDFEQRSALSGMFRNWYLEYASYVILERAVPHIDDGLKPVQRRILHSMQTLDDGRFNKVANIVGNTMQYHPHGDASIKDALVQLGQKDLLVSTQGNWGNILTGDEAAAGRYIEARLSQFALDVAFSPKITEWVPSYDGRKKEPVTLPIKFPLLLAQGVEGIAVGLSSKILPHNFNEILDAAVAYIKGEEFSLLPDFQTGGLIDASKYNDGARGGSVKVRAKIEKIDSKTLAITELPFGKTTSTLISSIIAAQEKGKIKIRKVDDNTSATAEIIVHLMPGTSADKTIDALYAFTDCEVSIYPICCVIRDKKPCFVTVSELLRHSVDSTMRMLARELEIKLGETRESLLFSSLEKIFIEKRMYKDAKIEDAPTMDAALDRLDQLLEPFKPSFFREISRDDLLRLWEIKMGRILKFNSQKADERIAALDEEIARLEYDIAHIREYTIRWYEDLKAKYGENYPRRTTVRGFDSILATKVAEANKRLSIDKNGGFIGTGLKDAEFLFTCSDLDDIIVIYKDGKYKLIKVQEKVYVGKKIEMVALYKKGDNRTVYNIIYRNGKDGVHYMKRCHLTGLTRTGEYDLTKGLPGSKIEWLTRNPNGEAETVKVTLTGEPIEPGGRPPRAKELTVNFADIAIKGRDSLGNQVTKYPVKSITLEKKGISTLGGRDVWFDKDVLRINYDGRGELIGTFQGDDKILVITKNGEFYTTSYSDTIHFEDNLLKIEKFDPHKVWTLVFFDPELGFPYLKRFNFEASARPQRFVGYSDQGEIILLTDTPRPVVHVEFGGDDAVRAPQDIVAEEFIAIKSFKAKGKRLSTYTIGSVTEGEPLEPETPAEEVSNTPDPGSEVESLPADSGAEAESVEVESVETEASAPADVQTPDDDDAHDDGKGPTVIQKGLFDDFD
ncbi:MAG: DNA gyrase/topoisomerase IV subunit A [Muribaculaceae bacterium]|nr:DNA gyrase/topoisomerase IV subunit A [Muribaculaceae bacterium]